MIVASFSFFLWFSFFPFLFFDNFSLHVVKFLHEKVTPRCTGWAVPISSYKIGLTVHLSEALTDSHPLGTSTLSKTQLRVQESRLLWGHFIKLSMLLFLGSEVTWPSDNVSIVTGRSIRIKEVINQVDEAAGDNTGPSLGGNSAATHSAGRAERCVHTAGCWQHGTKITVREGRLLLVHGNEI